MNDADDLPALTGDNLGAFDAAPQVAEPQRTWVMPLGIAAAVGLGLLTFSMMSASRAQNVARPVQPASAAPQPLPTAPPPAIVATPVPQTPAPQIVAVVPNPDIAARLNAPALIVDLSAADAPGGVDARNVAAAVGGEGMSGDERFAARFGGAQAARARPLANPQSTIPEGAIITAVLETAINSDLPGYVRALVSRDVQSFDGSAVLIPRGSRLVGQYRSGVSLGQSRAFVVWTRVMRPDGVTVDLNSPGADELGRGGLAGETDRHFVRRFGGAVLLTLLGAAADAAGDGNSTNVTIGVTRGAGDAASVALNEEINIPPTIRVDQGTPIRVFVSRDLDFSGVP